MKKTICNKLIRVNIPEIIEKSGKECDVKVLDDEEYIHKLKEKIIEGELADVLEITEAIEKYYSIEHGAVEKKKQDKAIKNGGFEKKLLLVETRE